MAKGSSNITMTNSFEGGMVSDLHPLASPSNTVLHALNMELITSGENQYIYQNIKGNKKVVDLPSYTDPITGVKSQFIPLGVKVSDNIAYILVGAFKPNGAFLVGGVGTFPSPDWSVINNGTTGRSILTEIFSFLHNYKIDSEGPSTSPFISSMFNFQKNRFIDIELQGDFDGSVNIIFTDNLNPTSIINSRFKRVESSQFVEIADRRGDNDSNIYTENDWDRIALIQNNNFPIGVEKPDGSDGLEITSGGYLRGGGYRYFLKYATQEGNTTEILYESPHIPITNGGLGLSKDQVSDKLVRFYLKDLDSSYAGIKLSFAHFDGEDAATMELFDVDFVFTYSGTTAVITHTGLESVTLVDQSTINVGFTPIDTVKSIAMINDRIALAGVSSTISESDINILTQAALDITIWEKQVSIADSYADPEMAAKYLGYWKGEVYELGVVFMLVGKGLSPVFPVTGMDNFKNEQVINPAFNAVSKLYPSYILDSEGFDSDFLINNKGLFRTSATGDIYRPEPGGKASRLVTYLELNTKALKENNLVDKIATGFFIVRRKRIKNVLMQGMATPTLRVPAKYPSLAEHVKPSQATLAMSRRYLMLHQQADNPTIGLNTAYRPVKDKEGDPQFNEEFVTVFVPQPTPVLNILTSEKSWTVVGSIGQNITSTFYGKTVTKEGVVTDKIHLAFYSCELDLNFPAIKGFLNGINPEIEVQGLRNSMSPYAYTYTYTNPATGRAAFKSESNLVIRNAENISMDRAPWIKFNSAGVRATLMDSGVISYSDGSFTAKLDRVLGFVSKNVTDNAVDAEYTKVTYALPYYPLVDGRWSMDGGKNTLTSNSKIEGFYGGFDRGSSKYYSDFFIYSIIAQSYSRYLGLEISVKDTSTPFSPLFNYMRVLVSSSSTLPYNSGVLQDTTGDVGNRKYTSIGHLANVFRSATGRWNKSNIRDIYKYDSNQPYGAASKRYIIETDSVDVFRGDGFISRIFKRITYKNGVPGSKSATSADAGDYGVGILTQKRASVNPDEMSVIEKDDAGRGLFDVGQIIEIATYANINADIRSIEVLNAEDSLLYGGDRNFYPNKSNLFGDARPDSTKYNHGYTGDINPISYNRILETSPTFNTEFPNRVLLSEKNQTQAFFNSFRNLKGFNYRDYGVEFGPIIKLISLKNILISIHPTGVILIGVDDKTLVAEGSDVFINTAEALSPTSKTVSDLYGSSNPESIVRTDTTISGVDYRASVVWVFEGDKLSIISEFAVKTILEEYKNIITTASFTGGVKSVSYLAKVYSTFDSSKHTLYISYVAEHPETKNQTHVGTITYNTVLQKWVSKISEGNKFAISIGSATYTTGFSSTGDIWKEDALTSQDGSSIRTVLRGIDTYTYEFEIVLNKESAVEKVLDNIRMITNKELPTTIVYTTNKDENDAAVNIWGEKTEEDILTQKIVTRNSSTRSNKRLGILDENAYYKNSGLYIEVGNISPSLRKAAGYKRVRDKAIRVRFIYTGHNETYIQGIISTLSISYN